MLVICEHVTKRRLGGVIVEPQKKHEGSKRIIGMNVLGTAWRSVNQKPMCSIIRETYPQFKQESLALKHISKNEREQKTKTVGT